MKLVLAAAVLAAVALAASARGSSHPNGVVLDGAIRCTAALTTPAWVPVGHELAVVFRLHNITTHWRNVELTDPQTHRPISWIVVAGPQGTTYDSRFLTPASFGGPPPEPTRIWAGATITEHVRVPIRWEGPLRITPGCGPSKKLRTIPVHVTSSGLPTSRSGAISEVVGAAGHFLDHCRPRTSGVAVVGRIDPPSGDAPPLRARCSVSLRREHGFYLAQVLVVTPPELQDVHLQQQPYDFVETHGAGRINEEAIAWEFAVTRSGAASVDWATSAQSRRGGGAIPAGTWNSHGWPRPSWWDSCGGHSWGWASARTTAAGWSGPNVEFVSVCGR